MKNQLFQIRFATQIAGALIAGGLLTACGNEKDEDSAIRSTVNQNQSSATVAVADGYAAGTTGGGWGKCHYRYFCVCF